MASSEIMMIVNPNAGNGSTGSKWPWVKEIAKSRLGSFRYVMTEGPGHAERLAEHAVKKGAGIIVCVGGDGTLNEIINGLMAVYRQAPNVVLGVIPDGTGCDFVRTVSIPRNIEKAIDVVSRRRTKAVDIGRIFFKDNRGRDCFRYFHNITSFGLGGEVDERVNRTTKAFGPFLSFIWATLISIFLYGKKKVRLTIDGETEKIFSIWNVAVANGQYHGGGMRVAPDASVEDGLFDITVIGDFSRPEVFYNLPKLYNGKINTLKKVVSFTGKHVTAVSDQRVLLDVDGEQPGMLPAVLDVIPGALTVISDFQP